MTNPIAVSPAVMITRIAQTQGASLTTQLAKVAQLRQEMQLATAALPENPDGAPSPLAHPANGAEVDRLI